MLDFLNKTRGAMAPPANLQELAQQSLDEQLSTLRRHQRTARIYADNCRSAIGSAAAIAVTMPILHVSTNITIGVTACCLLLAPWWYARKVLECRNITNIKDTISKYPGREIENDPQIFLDLTGAFLQSSRPTRLEAHWVVKAKDYLANLTHEQATNLTEEQKALICEVVETEQRHQHKPVKSINWLAVKTTLLPAAIHALQMLGGERATTALTNRATFTNSRRIRAASLRALHALNPKQAHHALRQAPVMSAKGYSRARFTRPVTVIFRLSGFLVACFLGGMGALSVNTVPIRDTGIVLVITAFILAIIIVLGALPLLGIEAVQDNKQYQQLYSAVSQDDPDSLKLLLTTRSVDRENWLYYFMLSTVLSNITAKCSTHIHPAQLALLNQLALYHITSSDFATTHQDIIHADLTNNLLAALSHIGDMSTAQMLRELQQQGIPSTYYDKVQRCLNAVELRMMQPSELLLISSPDTKQNLVQGSSAPEQNEDMLKGTNATTQ